MSSTHFKDGAWRQKSTTRMINEARAAKEYAAEMVGNRAAGRVRRGIEEDEFAKRYPSDLVISPRPAPAPGSPEC